MKNFIPINRKLFKHHFWKQKRKLSKFEAWLDILQFVSFKNNNKNFINNVLVKWNRGQFPISITYLAKRWGWGSKAVRNYLQLLKQEKMITLESTNKWTMLTVCKYEDYNKLGQGEGQSEGKPEAIKGQELNKFNNINKDKIEVFMKWIDFRKEMKKPIKVKSTLNNLIKKFNSTPLKVCEATVNSSIDNQYQGLFWDKFKDVKSNNQEELTYDENNYNE